MYFNSIVGQNFAKRYLTISINNNKISHAYMFEGIEGIGKNKLAVEFSKILLNIDNVKNSPDYIEINSSGSSLKISQVRELQTDIIVKPHGKYKIYVINDAHKMTIEAQNALLKTLEEPPEYAIIILITSNKERLLDTIKSRCEIIKFLPISVAEIKKYLIDNHIDSNRAQTLSVFARGSIKKALELSKDTELILMREDVQIYIQAMLGKNIVEVLDIPSSIDKYKLEIISLLDMMIDYFRDIMLIKEGIGKDMIINIDKIVFVQNMSKKIRYSQICKAMDIIEDTKVKIKGNCNLNTSIQVMSLNIYEVMK